MSRQVIGETRPDGLRPCGVAGRRVIDCWEQIDIYLRQQPDGMALANLFAEPVAQSDGRIIWFGPEGPVAQPYATLTCNAQEILRTRSHQLLAQLDGLSARLIASSDASGRELGEMLRLAQMVPAPPEERLYAVGSQPVLIQWSAEQEGKPVPISPLREFVRPLAPPAMPLTPQGAETSVPPPVESLPAAPVSNHAVITDVVVISRTPPRFAWWLLWLLFFLILGLIYRKLLPSCGIHGILDYCQETVYTESPVSPDLLRDAITQNNLLQAELRQLGQRLSQAPRCPSPQQSQPGSTPAQLPQDQSSREFDRRLSQRRAQSGTLTISLMWDSPSDLDLIVECPSGDRISFDKRAACGGRLDIDANVQQPIPSPVENIYFPEGGAAPGVYKVIVNNYEKRVSRATDSFKVRVKKGDEEIIRDGTLGHKKVQLILEVTMP